MAESMFEGQQNAQDKPHKPPVDGTPQDNEADCAALAAGVETAKALLRNGVRVTLTRDTSAGSRSVTEQGVLSLMASDLKFVAKKPKHRVSTTYLSNISGVELQQSSTHQASTGRILLKDGAAGSSFSFACTASSGHLSSAEVTKFVTLAVQGRVNGLQEKAAAGSTYQTKVAAPPASKIRRATNFTELLQPLDLVDKYGAAFEASRIPFENLSVVTADDLAELVGVTDRLDQINIKAEIKRTFPCCCGGQRREGMTDWEAARLGLRSAGTAVETFTSIVGSLAEL